LDLIRSPVLRSECDYVQVRLLAHQALEAFLARLPLQPCLALMLQAAAQQWAEPCTEPATLQANTLLDCPHICRCST
jgi:hypothetical protein